MVMMFGMSMVCLLGHAQWLFIAAYVDTMATDAGLVAQWCHIADRHWRCTVQRHEAEATRKSWVSTCMPLFWPVQSACRTYMPQAVSHKGSTCALHVQYSVPQNQLEAADREKIGISHSQALYCCKHTASQLGSTCKRLGLLLRFSVVATAWANLLLMLRTPVLHIQLFTPSCKQWCVILNQTETTMTDAIMLYRVEVQLQLWSIGCTLEDVWSFALTQPTLKTIMQLHYIKQPNWHHEAMQVWGAAAIWVDRLVRGRNSRVCCREAQDPYAVSYRRWQLPSHSSGTPYPFSPKSRLQCSCNRKHRMSLNITLITWHLHTWRMEIAFTRRSLCDQYLHSCNDTSDSQKCIVGRLLFAMTVLTRNCSQPILLDSTPYCSMTKMVLSWAVSTIIRVGVSPLTILIKTSGYVIEEEIHTGP